MGLRKYQSVEKTEVLAPADQQKVASSIHGFGKTSATQLTEEERKSLDFRKQ